MSIESTDIDLNVKLRLRFDFMVNLVRVTARQLAR